MILQPHHHEFAETLANLPFFYKRMASETCEVMHLIQSNPNCLPEIATADRLQEYLFGGEIDETIEFVDGYDNTNTCDENDLIEWELEDEWLGSI